MKPNKLAVLGLAMLVIIALVGGITWAFAAEDQSQEISACLNPAGQIRIVDSIEECKKQETPLTWNTEGPEGPAGVDCWDLDGDGVRDPEEDVNGDGAFDALDCQGPTGEQGDPGPQGDPGETGTDGLACWDLNGNGVGDIGTEDTNSDDSVDVDDCKGLKGDQGDP
ncbi:hypothetical protein ACFLX9_04240, partial [Chloroflexota bacterium]